MTNGQEASAAYLALVAEDLKVFTDADYALVAKAIEEDLNLGEQGHESRPGFHG